MWPEAEASHAVLDEGWRDEKIKPDNNRNVVVHYICHGVVVQTTAHYDDEYKQWYDWCGDYIEEEIVAWREKLPDPPAFV
jgi:hypothetical protein